MSLDMFLNNSYSVQTSYCCCCFRVFTLSKISIVRSNYSWQHVNFILYGGLNEIHYEIKHGTKVFR